MGILSFIIGVLIIIGGLWAGNIPWCNFGALLMIFGAIDSGLDAIKNEIRRK